MYNAHVLVNNVIGSNV